MGLYASSLSAGKAETVAIVIYSRDYAQTMARVRDQQATYNKITRLLSLASIRDTRFGLNDVVVFLWTNCPKWDSIGGKEFLFCLPKSFGFARLGDGIEDSISVGGRAFDGFFYVKRSLAWNHDS